ncbi:MAG: hypothetical protein FWD31_08750, partial [Planctomycetaceae bacterium]|nr:hypothetical protein [Planctomycetaceae bacterium]
TQPRDLRQNKKNMSPPQNSSIKSRLKQLTFNSKRLGIGDRGESAALRLRPKASGTNEVGLRFAAYPPTSPLEKSPLPIGLFKPLKNGKIRC